MSMQTKLITAMVEYEQDCPLRVQHFLKVFGFAKTIGESEYLESELQLILETAAIVHDIGIRPSLEKYNSSAGNYQQVEGPAVAEPLLHRLGFEPKIIDRVCYLIAHHHTYTNIDGLDYQILVEADFLVNFFEEEMTPETIRKVYDKVFITTTGRRFCQEMYSIHDEITATGSVNCQ